MPVVWLLAGSLILSGQDQSQPQPQAQNSTEAPHWLAVDLPQIASAVEDTTCDGLEVYRGATCRVAPAAETAGVIQAYADQLYVTRWLEAAGSDRRRIFIRRRAGGGCDGLQMLAVDRGERTLFVFAAIPGDACGPDSPILQEVP